LCPRAQGRGLEVLHDFGAQRPENARVAERETENRRPGARPQLREQKKREEVLGHRPRRDEAAARVKERVRGILGSGVVAPWCQVRDRLNRALRGWCAAV